MELAHSVYTLRQVLLLLLLLLSEEMPVVQR